MTSKSLIIVGKVVAGQKQGVKTGLKTANLDIDLAKKLKNKGLYSCSVTYKGTTYDGLLYYGHNSLSKKDCLEVHLINFDGDLYGKEIIISIDKFLRDPKKFSNIKKLSEQLEEDLKNATQ